MIDQIVCFTILFPFLFMYMAKHSVFLKLENWGKDEMKILYSHILIWDSKGEKNWLNVFPYEKTKLNSFQSNFFKTKKRIFRQVKRNETMFLSLVCLFVLFFFWSETSKNNNNNKRHWLWSWKKTSSSSFFNNDSIMMMNLKNKSWSLLSHYCLYYNYYFDNNDHINKHTITSYITHTLLSLLFTKKNYEDH